jgi:hypothetical protein
MQMHTCMYVHNLKNWNQLYPLTSLWKKNPASQCGHILWHSDDGRWSSWQRGDPNGYRSGPLGAAQLRVVVVGGPCCPSPRVVLASFMLVTIWSGDGSWRQRPRQRVSGFVVAPSSTGGGRPDALVVSGVVHPPVKPCPTSVWAGDGGVYAPFSCWRRHHCGLLSL